ncbi:MAG: ATP-binding protein [Gammaproteobacteria bacterium]|nr:ATP-binding protein [Gammaproteobacteria bacterium]
MRYIPYMVLAGFVLLLLLYRPFYIFVNDGYIINFWAGLVISVLLVSLSAYWINEKNDNRDKKLSIYLFRMLQVNAIAFASVWSMMLFIIFLSSDREYQLLLIILALGISAGAFPILVVFKYVYVIFVCIMLLPFVIALFFIVDSGLVAILLASLWVLLILSANKMGESMRALLYLKDVNIDLVHRLADANVDLEEFNKELKQENTYRVKSTDMFREKSQFLERIMDATSDGIMVFDKQGVIVRINTMVSNICGYSQEELLGRHYTDNIFPDSDPGLMGMVHEAYTQLNSHIHEPAWLLSCNGELKELKASVAVLMGQKSLNAVVCTLVDNTKEKKLERLKDEFVSNVSHELRTPLTSIHGSLRLLESGLDGSLSTNMDEMLSIAINNSRRLLEMVNELLDISKLDAGGLIYNNELCDAGELTREAVGAIQGYASSHQVDLQLKRCFDVSIYVDKKRFIQVLFNLISNAIKFTPAHKQVVVDMFIHEECLRLAVIDQGEGIAEAFQPYMFERYKQAKSGSKQKPHSSGLGLNIAKQMIESMGGTIAYKTDMGQGSAFYIDIPLADIQIGTQE